MKRILVGSVLALIGVLLAGSMGLPEVRPLHAEEYSQAEWTEVGAQAVVGESWNFDGQAILAPEQTFVRVTVQSCEGLPGGFMMEGDLQRQDVGRMGLDVWSGPLELVGTAAGVGSASGHARISRPVVQNPTSQIDVTLFGLTGVLRGAVLRVCVRTP
jgi:hypothetical protein